VSRRPWRLGLGVVLLTGAPVLVGCGTERKDAPEPLPTREVVREPAASAGGACRLLDYPTIEEMVGTRFEVAAAGRRKDTSTCLVRAEEAEHPDLVLSVSPTDADAALFNEELLPEGAKGVKGLGKAAYRLTVGPSREAGAAAEVGWLTGDKRLVTLRYTFPPGQERAAADELVDGLVRLAKKIDTSSL
jgi:hypothetical protein